MNRITRSHRGFCKTSSRSFSAISAYLTKINSAGATSFQATETVEADQFGTTRTADYAVQLPIDQLASGPYLLTVEVSLGKHTARRDVRFFVH